MAVRSARSWPPRTGTVVNVSFEPAADLPGIAQAAGGAYGVNVADPAELPQALKDALAAVHDGRSAVVAAHLPGVCMMASKLSVFCSTLTSSAGSPRTTSTSAK